MKRYLEQQEKYLFVLLAAFLLAITILPFSMPTTFHDSQRFISILATTALLGIRFLTMAAWSKTDIIAVLTLVVYGSITSALSIAPEWSFVEVSLFLMIILSVVFTFTNPDISLLTKLTLLFASTQSIYICRDLLNYIFSITSNNKLDVWDVIDGFSNIRFYAQFLSWTTPFLLGYITIKTDNKFRKAIITICILSWMLVLVSGTRAFILGITFSLLSTFWITPGIWKRYATWTILTGLAGAIGYLILIFILPGILGVDNSAALNSTVDRDFSNSSGRVKIWIDTLNIALSHPYTGIGPMMTAMDGVLDRVAHPHNFLLQLMAEWGIPFATAFMILAIYLAFRWKKLIAENAAERESLALPVTAAISSATAAGLVDGLMVMPVSLLYMSVILGFGAALWRTWTPDIKRFKAPVWFTVLLFTPVLSLAVFTTYQWIKIAKSDVIYSSAPRFWEDGKIKLIDNKFTMLTMQTHESKSTE